MDAPRAARHDEVAATGATLDQAGQKMLRLAAAARRHCAARQSFLNGLPGRVVDDAQVRHLGDLAGSLDVDARHALARVRIPNEPLAVPDQPANVEFVPQEAVAASERSHDRRLVPRSPAGAWDAFLVQDGRDLARVAPIDRHGEDAAHNLGLFLGDLTLTGAGEAIAVASASGEVAVAHAAAEAAVRLEGEVAQEQRAHRALEADMHLADAPIRHRPDLDARERHALVECGDVALIA
nr:hypothetical protein [Aureimonas sp. SK2]